MTPRSPEKYPAWVSVIAENTICIGHILSRWRGFEAYDADDKSLGIFASQSDAAKAIEASVHEDAMTG
jgi:hypothetical protein